MAGGVSLSLSKRAEPGTHAAISARGPAGASVTTTHVNENELLLSKTTRNDLRGWAMRVHGQTARIAQAGAGFLLVSLHARRSQNPSFKNTPHCNTPLQTGL